MDLLHTLVPRADDVFARAAHHLMAAKMYSLASFVMIYYDLFLTFGQELDTIWLVPKYNIMTLLWALNRYVLPLGYIVIVVSFHMRWNEDVCNDYILYPEALKIVATAAIGVIFILRVRAIFGRDMWITGFAWILLAVELGLKIWAFTDGVRLDLPDEFVGCILVGRHHTRIAFTWIAELIFDSVIFALTLYKTLQIYHVQLEKRRPMSLFVLIIRDGIVYFAVIFAANLGNVLVFMLAEDDIKAINASFSTLITSLMVSRLILNLKTAGRPPDDGHASGVKVHVSRQVETDVVITIDERSQAILTLNAALETPRHNSIVKFDTGRRGGKDEESTFGYEMPQLANSRYTIPRP